jgi:hypothetical protein
MKQDVFRLSDLDLRLVDQAWNAAKKDTGVTGKPLRIGGRVFTHGIGTHATSELLLRTDRKAKRLKGFVGVDDGTDGKASVRFSALGDGRELWNSGVRHTGEEAVPVDLDVSAVRLLTLRVEDAGDNNYHDHADWAEVVLEGVSKPPVALPRLPSDEKVWLPGRLWCDTDGNPIQAHGGGILRYGGKYYWYGEDRSNGYVAIGTAGYVSTDLLRWKRMGLVLPAAEYNQKHGAQTLCERPKVIYNPRTRKFVLWFHYDRSGYGDSQAGVAVADRPEGPFRFLGMHRPIATGTYRDMNLFVDAKDGAAYTFYASEENATMHVVRLNAEWTAPEQPMVEGKTWARILVRKMREAPAPFVHAGKYWLVTSGCTGWDPNPADIAVADHPLGPWKSLGNPCVGDGANTTFRTQSTHILPHPNGKSGEFIFMADRWKKEALADARYVWLPLTVTGDRAEIRWTDRWKP